MIITRVLRDDAADAVRAILIVVAAYFVMTLGDVAGKWALPVAGIAWLMLGRGTAGAAVCLGVAAHEGTWRRLWPQRWALVALRSLLHTAASIAWYVAWLFFSLGDTYAVGFTAPLIMTVLAFPMLGERIRWRRTLSTCIGFLGMLLIVRPGSALWRPEVLVLIPGVLGTAVSRIMARTLSTTETPECLTFWLMAVHVPVGLALLALGVRGAGPWTAEIAVAVVLLGAFNAYAHVMLARGYALAPVAALAPYKYTMLVWGLMLGWIVFHEVLTWSTLAGAAVVAAAGLYNLHRERVRRAEAMRGVA